MNKWIQLSLISEILSRLNLAKDKHLAPEKLKVQKTEENHIKIVIKYGKWGHLPFLK